ncbi:MAG: 4-hydroxybenzoate octaprenyltransferase [Gammaproteobacteria bacterium]|nr:4-hydroxybenzoate octaprenyltransferase [Gammaproteobacteria bacterium]
MTLIHLIPKSLHPYWYLARVDRPIGTLLLLWPTLWALFLAAGGVPSVKNTIIFVLGVFLMRSAGCVINDFADRKVDGLVSRTKQRPLATGQISSKGALIFFGLLVVVSFVLVLFTDQQTILLSVGALALASIYPFMKRYTYLPQVVLGAAFAWSIPMAFSAESGQLPNGMWLIYSAVVVWTVIYDTFYAMVDREDDIKVGIKSTAVLFGDQDRVITAALQVILVLHLWFIGERFELGIAFYIAIAVAVLLMIFQQWLIRARDPENCFRAFLNNQWVGMVVFFGIVGGV